MELICNFLKNSIPIFLNEQSVMMEIFLSVAQYGNIHTKLETYETEFYVMHEMKASSHHAESMNELFIEQLAMCRGAIVALENTVSSLHKIIEEQQQRLSMLENQQSLTPPTYTLPVTDSSVTSRNSDDDLSNNRLQNH